MQRNAAVNVVRKVLGRKLPRVTRSSGLMKYSGRNVGLTSGALLFSIGASRALLPGVGFVRAVVAVGTQAVTGGVPSRTVVAGQTIDALVRPLQPELPAERLGGAGGFECRLRAFLAVMAWWTFQPEKRQQVD